MSGDGGGSTHDTLRAEHARIDTLLRELEEQAGADVRPELERTWAELEHALLSHLDEEEMFLFPWIEKEDPAEVRHLAADHAELRALLGELGVGVELHAVRAETIHALAEKIRAHAAREDTKLYLWADRSVLPGPRALAARLARARARRA